MTHNDFIAVRVDRALDVAVVAFVGNISERTITDARMPTPIALTRFVSPMHRLRARILASLIVGELPTIRPRRDLRHFPQQIGRRRKRIVRVHPRFTGAEDGVDGTIAHHFETGVLYRSSFRLRWLSSQR